MPRRASAGKQYEELNETPSPKKRRPISAKPKASGPSEARISAQHNKSPYPSRRLPPISSNGDDDGTDDSTADQPHHLQKHHHQTNQTIHPPRRKVLSQPKVIPCVKNTQIESTSARCVLIEVTVPVI